MKMRGVVTFGNDVGGVKEVIDQMIGDMIQMRWAKVKELKM